MPVCIIINADFNRQLPGNKPVRQLIWLPFFMGEML
jgi:hypothetical protein